jgi:hypothetical protein
VLRVRVQGEDLVWVEQVDHWPAMLEQGGVPLSHPGSRQGWQVKLQVQERFTLLQ